MSLRPCDDRLSRKASTGAPGHAEEWFQLIWPWPLRFVKGLGRRPREAAPFLAIPVVSPETTARAVPREAGLGKVNVLLL